ncbi:hypothetical protein CesoFtcFv8_021810 [Champsocephalus esox]|uniref:Uncharacterized protein n=1 Tax=Champsocephalus esox TaxID=159716 RepID=A0AAN8GJ58_9TELE|nr:hypothetical protein CesoFtcFv8_021810 [Champsocephalus esox]
MSNKASNCRPSWHRHGHGRQPQSYLPPALPSIPSQLRILLLDVLIRAGRELLSPDNCPPPLLPSVPASSAISLSSAPNRVI